MAYQATDEDDKCFQYFLQGNEKGLEYFMKRWYNPIYVYAQKIVKDSFEARTAIQDAFMHTWENRAHINDIKHLFNYTRQQVKWQCLGAIRKSGKRKTIAFDLFEDQLMELDDSTTIMARQQEMQTKTVQLEQALTYLPGNIATIVKLWKDGFSPHQIARMQQTSHQHITADIKRGITGLKRIQDRLAKAALVTTKHQQYALADYKVYLNNEQALIFRLYYEENYKLQQIADILHLSLFQLQQQHARIQQIIHTKPKII